MKKHFSVGEGIFLSLICAFSFVLLLLGLNGDAPYAFESDEWDYGPHTVWMLQSNSLNPKWFANPASTVYYALYLYYALLRQVYSTNLFPDGMDNTRISFEHMALLVLVPRFVNALLTVATVFLTYIVGRRWLGKGAAAVATIMFALCSEAIRLGQVLRTDALTDFLLLLGLWLVQKVDGEPEKRAYAIAGAVVTALATSTRYFGLALCAPFLVTYILNFWQTKRKDSLVNLALYLVLTPLLFFCFSPFVLLDFQTALSDLRFEATSDLPGVSGASFMQHVSYYAFDCLPFFFGAILTVAIALGFFLVILRRPNKMTASLLIFLIVFALGTCLNTRIWYRWMVPLVPGLGMLAGFALMTVSDGATKILSFVVRPPLAGTISFLSIASIFCASMVVPIGSVYLMELDKWRYSGNARIYQFVRDHVPPHAKIAVDFDWCWTGIWNYDVKTNAAKYEADEPRAYVSPSDLRKEGYEYLIVGEWNRSFFEDEAKKYPQQAHFYEDVAKLGCPLFTSKANTETLFGGSAYNRNSPFSIYKLCSEKN